MPEQPLGMLGKYQVLEEIGRGGFSVVYRAEHPKLKKTVAIKLMLPALFSDPDAIQRFIQEARAVAAIKHDNITQVLDLAEEHGRLYMVMEYLPGGDLRAWLEKHGKLSFRHSVDVVAAIAAALDYAHSQGILHGDIKPGNILMSAEGTAKLTDFGVLRAVESSGVTSADMTRGTPYYISPEQAEGGRPTSLSDQYALGVVAYELLTGRVPFDGDTPLAIYLKHVRETPPPAGQANPLITPTLDSALARALEKDPAKRYRYCRAFARALRQAVAATEASQFQDLIKRAGESLAAHQPEAARPLIESALQIQPDDAKAQALLDDLQTRERAQRGYQDASEALASATLAAHQLRAQSEPPPDPKGLLLHLAPPPPPPWKRLLLRWQWGLILALILCLLGASLGLGDMAYTSQGGAGELRRQTLMAGVRTSTVTATLTLTLTPTTTFTLTPTSTFTPTFTFTPTITPTPTATLGIGSVIFSEKDFMQLVFVPAGNFQMGSNDGVTTDESPMHTVYLDDYWLDSTEITNAMYMLCVKADKCSKPNDGYGNDIYYADSNYADYPVVYVSWNAATTYCEWAERRLPSEAEWEKGARGTDGRKYPWGNFPPTSDLLSYNKNLSDMTFVGKYPLGASPYGALDMAGNIWEWVADWYDKNYYKNSPTTNPLGPSSGTSRALRGGSWGDSSNVVRSANRDAGYDPNISRFYVGFRCASSR